MSHRQDWSYYLGKNKSHLKRLEKWRVVDCCLWSLVKAGVMRFTLLRNEMLTNGPDAAISAPDDENNAHPSDCRK
jgi:hypothetical protein